VAGAAGAAEAVVEAAAAVDAALASSAASFHVRGYRTNAALSTRYT
jgi:hypothetical protein